MLTAVPTRSRVGQKLKANADMRQGNRESAPVEEEISMRRSICLLFVGLLLFASALEVAGAERPNMILIIADDLGAEDCGPFGNGRVRTPQLDRLAREGLRCDRAFVTCSSCSPSRATLLTGRYPHQTGAEQLHWPLPAEQVGFTE